MRIMRTHIVLLLRRIVLLYVVMIVCRAVMLFANAEMTASLSAGGWWNALCGSLRFDTASIAYLNALYVIMALIPLHLREMKGWQSIMFWYYIVVNVLFMIVPNMIDAVCSGSLGRRITMGDLSAVSFDAVTNSFVTHWYVFLTGAICVVLLVWGYRRKIQAEAIFADGWYYIFGSVIFACGLWALWGAVNSNNGGERHLLAPSDASAYAAEGDAAAFIEGNPFGLIQRARNFNLGCMITLGHGTNEGKDDIPLPTNYFDKTELDKIYKPEHIPYVGGGKAELAGRNVVMFIMGGFTAEHSAVLRGDLYEAGAASYTPFLDSLMRQGYIFRRAYANGRSPVKALSAVMGSMTSYETPFARSRARAAKRSELPAMLKDAGYETMLFCATENDRSDVKPYAASAGVERVYWPKDMAAMEGGDAASATLKFVAGALQSAKQPFLAVVDIPSASAITGRGEKESQQAYTDNFAYVKAADMSLRSFFGDVAAAEWFANTLFVFVGDAVSSVEGSVEQPVLPADYHVYGFMYAPESSLAGESGQVVSQVDIMPTVLGLLGNEKPYFAFGRDVFGEYPTVNIAVSYGNGMFQAITDSYIMRFDGQAVRGIYAVDDLRQQNDLSAQTADNASAQGATVSTKSTEGVANEAEQAERLLKAMIQSYYTQTENNNLIINDSIQGDPTFR